MNVIELDENFVFTFARYKRVLNYSYTTGLYMYRFIYLHDCILHDSYITWFVYLHDSIPIGL